MQNREKLAVLVNDLESVLIELNVWESMSPNQEALTSSAPFAVDSLNATQWLQWIFIIKMRILLEQNLPLPLALEITPYLEQALHTKIKEKIIAVTAKIDALFCGTFDD